MTDLKFLVKDPESGYITNNLLLPKGHITVPAVKAALEFQYGEEPELDDAGEIVRYAPGTLRLWDENATHLIVPREFLSEKERARFDFPFVDHSYQEFEAVDIEDKISYRDEEQQEAFRVFLESRGGTLNLACGKGKTVLALKLAATLKVPTMVVVNTTALLEQWREEIQNHLKVGSVGVVQGPTVDWEGHPIVLAMVHTLAMKSHKWPVEFRRRFGLVIYDEGHHMSAPVFVKSADLFSGRRYSLTATADRTDGLESIYQYHLGRVFYSDLSQELVPRTSFKVLNWTIPPMDKEQVLDVNGDVHSSKVKTYLGTLGWRNDLIYDDLLADVNEGKKILVLSHSKDHCGRMHERFNRAGGGLITGDIDQGERIPILRECNPVFGTFQLARESLNKPSLDVLVIVTPFGNSNDAQQALGRIQRQYEGKDSPEVRVYEDTAFNCCVKACRQLRKYLKKMNYPFKRKHFHLEEV